MPTHSLYTPIHTAIAQLANQNPHRYERLIKGEYGRIPAHAKHHDTGHMSIFWYSWEARQLLDNITNMG